MPSSLPPRALSFLMMSPVSLCRAAWHTAWVLRCIDLYPSLYRVVCRLPSGFFSFIPLMLTVWTYFLLPEKCQDPHCSTCIHLVRWNAWKLWRNFSKRERCRCAETISPAKIFDCHQPWGQLAWELVNIPSRRVNGCRRLAPTLQPRLAPLQQTSLLVWTPSSPLFAAFPLFYLETACGRALCSSGSYSTY